MAIFQARAFKFGSVGALDTLIDMNPRIYDNLKIKFWRLFDTFSSYVIKKATVSAINKKNVLLIEFIFVMQIH